MDPSLLAGLLLILFPHLAVAPDISEPPPIVLEDHRAELLDAYFEERSMPLAGYGEAFVIAADLYGIDWRLLPAIGVRESSGGKHMCGNNPFGWGSCTLQDFTSIEEAITKVAWNLGGHNPRTSAYYSGTTYEKLWSFNGTVLASYPDEVIAIMNQIGSESL